MLDRRVLSPGCSLLRTPFDSLTQPRSFDQLWLCIVQQSGEGLSLVFLFIVRPSPILAVRSPSDPLPCYAVACRRRDQPSRRFLARPPADDDHPSGVLFSLRRYPHRPRSVPSSPPFSFPLTPSYAQSSTTAGSAPSTHPSSPPLPHANPTPSSPPSPPPTPPTRSTPRCATGAISSRTSEACAWSLESGLLRGG